MTELFRRIHYLLNRARLERELREEMAEHQEQARAAGAGQDSFGSPTHFIEVTRDVWGWNWLDRLFQDLHYGFRVLRKSPGFTGTAILILALGIGVNLTGLRMAFLEMTPTERDPDTLVEIARWFPNGSGNTISYPVLSFYAQYAHSFRAVIATHEDSVVFGGARLGIEPERVAVNFVTANYFAEQAPPMVCGRPLLAVRDEARDSEPVVVLSRRFWENHFGAATGTIGQTISLNGKTVRVVGVLNKPRGHQVDMWMALAQQPYIVDGSKILSDWTTSTIYASARLNPGVSVSAAEQESRVLAAALHRERPDAVGKDERLQFAPFSSVQLKPQEAVTAAMSALLVQLILVVACANLGSLLLARGVTREREIWIRTSVGASRLRIIRQLLTESTMIAVAGSTAGWILSALALRVFLLQNGEPLDRAAAFDWRVMAATAVIAILAAAAFGLTPALRMTSSAPQAGRARAAFLAVQIGASCILLIISGQLVRSFGKLLNLDAGFEYRNVLVISPELHAHGYTDSAARQYVDNLRLRLRTVPEVKGVSATWLPVWGNIASTFFVAGHKARLNRVDGEFIGALGLHLSVGRSFRSDEQGVALVSGSFAGLHWPGENPIGKRLNDYPGPATVVGVVGMATTFVPGEEDTAAVYMPLTAADYGVASLVVRVAGEPVRFASKLSAIAAPLGPKLRPTYSPLQNAYDQTVVRQRVLSTVLSFLAGLATILAAIGLAGLTSYTVAQRVREIGVRIALGATRSDVIRALLRPLAVPVASGIVGGVFLAAGVSAVMRSVISGLRPADPAAYLMAIAALSLVMTLAVSMPARLAVRIQPAEALRHE
jgi:predicted permease